MQDSRLKKHELGFLELADKPSPSELAAYYEKNYYQNQAAGYRKSYSTLESDVIDLRVAQRAALAFSLLQNTNPGSLLDVGCGEGFVIKHFKRLGWDVSGIDFSIAGVEHLNPDCLPFVLQGDVFQLLESKISKGEKYNLVWLGNVLEHVLDPVELLISLRKLVAKDGLVVVTVPNDGNAYHESLFNQGNISKRFWIAPPDHISYFTKESLKNTATATGWDCLALQGDFPIDIYLAHKGSNYVNDKSLGPEAHQARLKLEHLIGSSGVDAANRFYTALADVGLGRNLTAYLRAKADD